MEIQHCEMRWELPPAVLQGLPKAWEHGHNHPLACGKQHALPAVGIPPDIPPRQPQPANHEPAISSAGTDFQER